MKVKELIKELEKFDEEMDVCFDCDDGWSTDEIDKIIIANKYYDEDCDKAVILK